MLPVICALLLGLPPDVQAVLDAARAGPPEIAANALLQLAASDAIRGRELKLALFEEAFQLAPGVEYAWPKRYVGPVESAGATREWNLDQAEKPGLDTLSIQCRAVRGVLPLDAPKARSLFSRIPPLSLPAFTCADALVPEPSLFWQTLQMVADQAFSPEERKRQDHVELIAGRVRAIASAVDLAPAAVAIRVAKLTPEERGMLISAYAARLAEVARCGARYAFAARQFDLASRVVALAETAAAQGISADSLLRAWREFLVAYASGARCADRDFDHRVFWQPFGESWIEQFNERLRLPGRLIGTELPEITSGQTHPVRGEGSARLERLHEGADARELATVQRQLWFGADRDRARPMEERRGDLWQAQAEQFIARLEAWGPASDESEAAYFHEKADFYVPLIELLPRGPLAVRAIKGFAAFLGEHPMERSHPAEWLLQVRRLLELTRVPEKNSGPFENAEQPNENGPAILDELMNARDPLLVLMARLEKLR